MSEAIQYIIVMAVIAAAALLLIRALRKKPDKTAGSDCAGCPLQDHCKKQK